MGSLESQVEEIALDLTGTEAASRLEMCLREPRSSIQRLVPSVGATAVIQEGR